MARRRGQTQTLLWAEGRLRTRAMQSDYQVTMPVNGGFIALPTGFLDAIGDIEAVTYKAASGTRIRGLRPGQPDVLSPNGPKDSNIVSARVI